jgi:hypothetical protein
MPKLLAFVPCERVIVAKDDNSTTLISLMQGLHIELPEDAPDKVVAPMSWATFSLWYKQPGDEGVTYEQRVELIDPDGQVLAAQTGEFQMDKTFHRHTNRSFGVPLRRGGDYTLRLSLRRVGSEFATVMEYPWPIERVVSARAVRA